jgi:hypothetical protein
MGGEIDWSALPLIIEMLYVEDVEKLIIQLMEIREFKGRG